MKKVLIMIVIVLSVCLLASPVIARQKADKKQVAATEQNQVVTKTYFLKHISPQEVRSALNVYILQSSFSRSSSMITVRLYKSNLVTFEGLLKKMDVEQKSVFLRIFTVIASNDKKGDGIENRDLRRVLDELKKVLSFESFQLDGVSAMMLRDGQGSSHLNLSSESSVLEFEVKNVLVNNEKPGNRKVHFRFSLYQEVRAPTKENPSRMRNRSLISSETSILENGYLVAGVSKIGDNGDSLVLVIHATIK